MLKFYSYAKCDTCRKALRFLQGHDVAFTEIPIRETPPTKPELRAMLAASGGPLRRLFNTSGVDYRALGLGARLSTLSETEALDLLASNGNLVKRPFAVDEKTHLLGFDEERWRAALLP
jgi:arsenate reductase